MSLLAAKQYAKTRMDGLGYSEWRDGFAFDNIPRTLFDGAYFTEMGEVTGIANNQDHQECEVQMFVRLFKKGFRDPRSKTDTSFTLAEAIIADFIDPDNRISATVHNIRFETMSLAGVETNDNSIIIELEFTALVFLDTRG